MHEYAELCIFMRVAKPDRQRLIQRLLSEQTIDSQHERCDLHSGVLHYVKEQSAISFGYAMTFDEERNARL